MPWPREYKSKTRARILEAAAAALREQGTAGIGVAGIMARAGLTHGGFYAHFGSKDDLLRAAFEVADRQTRERLAAAVPTARAGGQVQAVVNTYLSEMHAAHPERGCPLAALGPELARMSGPVRRDLRRAIGDRLAWLRDLMPGRQSTARRERQAIGTLACMVGGIVLARAAGGTDAAAILEGCRQFLDEALTREGDESARAPKRRGDSAGE